MWDVVGHNRVIKELESSIQLDRLAHAYIFVGPSQVGKGTLAINLAQAVNCLAPTDGPCNQCSQCLRIFNGLHTDVKVIGPTQTTHTSRSQTTITIEDIRTMEHEAYLKPYEGRHRVFILDGAEHLNMEASNAILKTLEEPPDLSIIILLTSEENRILPTIQSRCRRLEMSAISCSHIVHHLTTNYPIKMEDAETIAHLSKGRFGWALSHMNNPEFWRQRESELEHMINLRDSHLEQRFRIASNVATLFQRDRTSAIAVLEIWSDWWRDLLLVREGVESSIYNVDYIAKLRENAKMHSSYDIASFALSIIRTIQSLNKNGSPRLNLEALMLSVPA